MDTGRVIAQAFIRHPVTANAQDQSQAIVREIWMKKVGNGSDTLFFPCQY